MISLNEQERKSSNQDESATQQDDLNSIWRTSQFLQSRNWIDKHILEQSELII